VTLFLKVSSVYSIFAQVPKMFHSILALQAGFFQYLGDVDAVLLDLVCLVYIYIIHTKVYHNNPRIFEIMIMMIMIMIII